MDPQAHTPFLDQLHALSDPERAVGMKGYHKADRVYLGLSNPQLNDLTKTWRGELSVEERVAVAAGLCALTYTKPVSPHRNC